MNAKFKRTAFKKKEKLLCNIINVSTATFDQFIVFMCVFVCIKAAVRNFFGLKIIRNQYLSKYITSHCSKLSPYFSRFTMVIL